VGAHQAFDALPEFRLAGTDLAQERQLLAERRLLQGAVKEVFFDHGNARFPLPCLTRKARKKHHQKCGGLRGRGPRRAARSGPRSWARRPARLRPTFSWTVQAGPAALTRRVSVASPGGSKTQSGGGFSDAGQTQTVPSPRYPRP